MAQTLTRSNSFRKPVRPLIDRDEEDDNQRRDASGRKRVDVVDCLLESSSDEIDDLHVTVENVNPILWLTFNEICHIRSVLAQTTRSLLMLNDEKQWSKISHGQICFRCRKSIHTLFFLPSFLRFTRSYGCLICQQTICKNCSFFNFLPPSQKLSIPVRIQTLTKSISNSIDRDRDKSSEINPLATTVCYDCLQVFHEHMQTSHTHVKPTVSQFRRTLSLPPQSSKTSDNTRYTRHRRRRPIQITKYQVETKTIKATSVITEI